jgi:hypothetical protein
VIPPFNHSNVLPPFLGEQLSQELASPYRTSALELAQRLGSSAERRALLVRFFALRRTLRDAGFATGFMWIDGSFAEDVETHRGTPPQDIDVVFFTRAPTDCETAQKVRERMDANPELFVRERCKQQFNCDFFIIDLNKAPEKLVAETRYWYGLFSHRRGDLVWKGMLEVPMDSDDAGALAMLDNPMSTTQGDGHVAAA